jgi:hypothetical protein
MTVIWVKETPDTASAPVSKLTATLTATLAASQSSVSGGNRFRADGATKSAPEVMRCPWHAWLSTAVHCFKSSGAVLDKIGAPFREIVDAVGSYYRLEASDPLLNIEGTLTVCHATRVQHSDAGDTDTWQNFFQSISQTNEVWQKLLGMAGFTI